MVIVDMYGGVTYWFNFSKQMTYKIWNIYWVNYQNIQALEILRWVEEKEFF